jgi:hypothetical protein
LALNGRASKRRGNARRTGTVGASLKSTGRDSNGTEISINSSDRPGSTFLWEASPASLPLTPASDSAKQTPVGSGPNSHVLLMQYDRGTRWLRTFPDSARKALTKFSQTLPALGMTRNGKLYLLPRVAPRTLGKGSLLWPTPKATFSGPDYARMNRPRSGGDDLVTAVAREMWGTPTARDHKDVGDLSKVPEKGLLPRQVYNREFSRAGQLPGGSLNPDWVEWLMGFPPGWTDLED